MSFDVLQSDSIWLRPERLSEFSVWRGHLPFAMLLIEKLRPRRVVELGTHYGDSYCAFCQGVVAAGLRQNTRCFAVDTWAGDDQAGFYDNDIWGDLSQFHNARFRDFSTLLRMTFEEAVTQFEDGTIDLLHIDGLHTYEAVKQDFETYLPKLSPDAVVLFHDIAVTEEGFGVYRFWEEVCRERASFSFLHAGGLGVLATGTPPSALDFLWKATDAEVRQTRTVFEHLGERWSLEGTLRRSDRERDEARAEIEEYKAYQNELQTGCKTFETDLRRVMNEKALLVEDVEALRLRVAKVESSLAFKIAKNIGLVSKR